jgi:uncharacterized protein (DUF1330 family)
MPPIAMFNALWFAEGGPASYAEYGAAAMPLLEEAGAEVLFPPLPLGEALEGDFDPDLAFFIRYPSAEAFDAMWTSDAYEEVSTHRTRALRKAVLTRCTIEPEHSDAVLLEPGIVVLNMLWFRPGGRARYDDYLAAAAPHVHAVGGHYLSPRFIPDRDIEGGFRPDQIFIGHYPSREALDELIASPRYLDAARIRGEAVDRSVTTTLVVAAE